MDSSALTTPQIFDNMNTNNPSGEIVSLKKDPPDNPLEELCKDPDDDDFFSGFSSSDDDICDDIINYKPLINIPDNTGVKVLGSFDDEALTLIENISIYTNNFAYFRTLTDNCAEFSNEKLTTTHSRKLAYHILDHYKHVDIYYYSFYKIIKMEVVSLIVSDIRKMLVYYEMHFSTNDKYQQFTMNPCLISFMNDVTGASGNNIYLLGAAIKILMEHRKSRSRNIPMEIHNILAMVTVPITGTDSSPLTQQELEALKLYFKSSSVSITELFVRSAQEMHEHLDTSFTFNNGERLITVLRSAWMQLITKAALITHNI